jgi:hypothetical protein
MPVVPEGTGTRPDPRRLIPPVPPPILSLGT